MADLLSMKPGQAVPEAVNILNRVRQLPAMQGVFSDLLRHAKGLVFMTTYKAGILYVAPQVGSGFVIAHLPDGRWSPPSFFEWFAAGGGLTLGVSKATTLIVLASDRALDQYKLSDTDFKFGAGLTVDYLTDIDKLDGRSIAAKLSSGDRDAFVFNFAKGLLFDLTVTGGVTKTDKRTNHTVYNNAFVTPAQILNGEVGYPPAAGPLYQALSV